MLHLHVHRDELEVAILAIGISSVRLLCTLDGIVSIN